MSQTQKRKSDGNKEPASQTLHSRSFGELITDLFRESFTILRKELELAKREVSQTASKSTRDTLFLMAGAGVAYAGFLCLLAAAVLSLSRFMPPSLAALLVGLALMGIGAIAMLLHQKLLREKDFAPRTTMESLNEDKEWIKDKLT